MQIKTLSELIERTRALHEKLATCLAHCALRHSDERVSILLEYLAPHEASIAAMVAEFSQQADSKAANTLVYDYILRNPVVTHLVCDEHYLHMTAAAINAEVFDFHEEINVLYRTLLDTAVIPEAKALMQALLDMEEHETKRLVRQVARMDDL